MAATPHIAKLVDVYEDLNAVHIIMEECEGQELYDEVAAGGLNEDLIARIMWQGLTALSYMHNVCHVCHRDLKASNFLFNKHFLGEGITDEEDIDIRIIDFGFSIHVNVPKKNEAEAHDKPADAIAPENDNADKSDEKDKKNVNGSGKLEPDDIKSISENTAATATTSPMLGAPANDPTDHKLLSANGVMTSEVGTPYYTAPEVVCADHYDFKCDVYSMGAIAYSCLTGGKLPIKGKDERETIKLLMNPKEPIDFSDKVWLGYREEKKGERGTRGSAIDDGDKPVSESARDFCKTLLQRDPQNRPSAYEALQHDWLKSRFGAPPPLPEPIPDDLVDFVKLSSLPSTA
jgi:serine/threonine protein kinase